MGVIEEFEKLTKNQKEELSKDINELTQSLIEDGHLTNKQQVTSWQHIRLEDEIYLYAEINFKLNPQTKKVDGKLLSMKRFKNRNDYFKSVYETKSN
jgi:ABC-type siderophore export system fused ATPase/permease subunit